MISRAVLDTEGPEEDVQHLSRYKDDAMVSGSQVDHRCWRTCAEKVDWKMKTCRSGRRKSLDTFGTNLQRGFARVSSGRARGSAFVPAAHSLRAGTRGQLVDVSIGTLVDTGSGTAATATGSDSAATAVTSCSVGLSWWLLSCASLSPASALRLHRWKMEQNQQAAEHKTVTWRGELSSQQCPVEEHQLPQACGGRKGGKGAITFAYVYQHC